MLVARLSFLSVVLFNAPFADAQECVGERNTERCRPLLLQTSPVEGCDCYSFCVDEDTDEILADDCCEFGISCFLGADSCQGNGQAERTEGK